MPFYITLAIWYGLFQTFYYTIKDGYFDTCLMFSCTCLFVHLAATKST